MKNVTRTKFTVGLYFARNEARKLNVELKGRVLKDLVEADLK
jgi:hypothetical protein